jgi:hypothetical protein
VGAPAGAGAAAAALVFLAVVALGIARVEASVGNERERERDAADAARLRFCVPASGEADWNKKLENPSYSNIHYNTRTSTSRYSEESSPTTTLILTTLHDASPRPLKFHSVSIGCFLPFTSSTR